MSNKAIKGLKSDQGTSIQGQVESQCIGKTEELEMKLGETVEGVKPKLILICSCLLLSQGVNKNTL